MASCLITFDSWFQLTVSKPPEENRLIAYAHNVFFWFLAYFFQAILWSGVIVWVFVLVLYGWVYCVDKQDKQRWKLSVDRKIPAGVNVAELGWKFAWTQISFKEKNNMCNVQKL